MRINPRRYKMLAPRRRIFEIFIGSPKIGIFIGTIYKNWETGEWTIGYSKSIYEYEYPLGKVKSISQIRAWAKRYGLTLSLIEPYKKPEKTVVPETVAKKYWRLTAFRSTIQGIRENSVNLRNMSTKKIEKIIRDAFNTDPNIKLITAFAGNEKQYMKLWNTYHRY